MIRLPELLRRMHLIEDLWQDLNYGLRSLANSPRFAIAAVMTLALGIGSTTAVFTLIDAVLLRPLPVPEPERLVAIYHTNLRHPESFLTTSYPDYLDYRDRNEVFAGLAAYAHIPVNINSGERTDSVNAVFATGNYFQILGVAPEMGRGLQPEDDKAGAPPVAIVSYRLWQSRFGADPDLVGKIVRIGGNPFTLIGVVPQGFRGVILDWGAPPDLWIPMAMIKQATPLFRTRDVLNNRPMDWLLAVGRLKADLSVAQAEASLRTLADSLRQTYSRPDGQRTITVLPIQEARFWPAYRKPIIHYLAILMCSVAMLLLIACANVANLLLARFIARRREIGTRLALGATPGRLVRQLLTESLLLSLLGTVAGCFVAWWMSSLLFAFEAPFARVSLHLERSLDIRGLGFAVVLSAGCVFLFGLAPALRARSLDVLSTIKSSGLGASSASDGSGLGRALVVIQVALSLVLLIGAGLFIRTLQKAYRIDPGYATANLAFVTVDLMTQGYSDEKGKMFFRQLHERTAALPGVRSAAWTWNIPLTIDRVSSPVRSVGSGENDWIPAERNIVGTEYMRTLAIPLLKGRDFGPQDTENSPFVAIVNETMAQKLWPGSDPIGELFEIGGKDHHPAQVIGVVKNVKYHHLWENSRPYYYLALSQNFNGIMTIVLAAEHQPPASLLGALHREISELDRDLPVDNGGTWEGHMNNVLSSQRMGFTLLALSGLTALILSTVGVYGVLAHSASRRTRAIGIRIAIGADRADILKLVLREGLIPILIGIILGLVTGIFLSRVVAHHIVGIEQQDPIPYITATIVLAATGMLASYLPARRAARIDPIVALRYE